MSIEKMDEQIRKWKEQKKSYDEQMDKKISDMEKKRDLALAAQTRRIFARHHLSSDELLKLKYANKQQLQKVLDFIEEIEEPAKPGQVTASEDKKEKENQNNAKELNT